MFIRPFYKDGILTLGVDEILVLYYIKKNIDKNFNRGVLDNLRGKGLLNNDSQGRLILSPRYYAYKRLDNQKIGPYQISDIRNFVIALGNTDAKSIGAISKQYQEDPNRNQLKYLITKLIVDKIIISSGIRKGTKYQLNEKFRDYQDVNALMDAITRFLRDIYQ